MERQVVTGPMVATFSFQDGILGQVYALASRVVGGGFAVGAMGSSLVGAIRLRRRCDHTLRVGAIRLRCRCEGSSPSVRFR